MLHPRFRTPYIAITMFGLIACVAIIPGQADFLGMIYAFGAMLSFTIAHLSVIKLRINQPDARAAVPVAGHRATSAAARCRCSRCSAASAPGSRWWWPPCSTSACWSPALAWLAFGILLYVVYRRRQGLSLTETHKIVTPKPVVEHEVEYESILVAFEDGDYSRRGGGHGGAAGGPRRRGIHVLVTITVPPNAPIDASLPEQEARAASLIDSARVRGGRRVTGHWEKVRPGEAGRRIVEEAREIRARALVMTLPPRRTGASLFGRTLETVLAERPCRVIIESTPGRRHGRTAA